MPPEIREAGGIVFKWMGAYCWFVGVGWNSNGSNHRDLFSEGFETWPYSAEEHRGIPNMDENMEPIPNKSTIAALEKLINRFLSAGWEYYETDPGSKWWYRRFVKRYGS
jgi:hypothetical protein